MKRRVLFVAAHPIEVPSTRFRIHQYLPYLDAAGIGYTVSPFLSSALAPRAYAGGLPGKLAVTAWGAARRGADLIRAGRYDLVYVLREAFPLGPALLEPLMQRLAGRLVFDFDDAIWHRWTHHENPLDRFRPASRPAAIIRRATHVVAGSPLLACYARRYAADPNRVSILPTVVDTELWRPGGASRGDGTVVVGWIGTPRNTGFIRAVWPALARAAARDPRIRYRFIGAEPFDPGPVAVEFRPWSMATEVADLQTLDIGIMPLPDNESTRGKCGFKLIEYMACGIPSLASPVGANTTVIRDGIDGQLVPDGAWEEAVTGLAADADRRRRMGQSGRERAEAVYSLRSAAPRFVAILQDAMGVAGG